MDAQSDGLNGIDRCKFPKRTETERERERAFVCGNIKRKKDALTLVFQQSKG